MAFIKSKSYIISVSIGTGCYRHIRISTAATLAELHMAILRAFEFDDDHAHAFFMNNRIWDDNDAYYADFIEEEPLHTSDYRLSQVIKGEGHKFVYVFDFGEEWRFNCRVLHETDNFTPVAQVVSEKGEAPLQYGEFEDDDIENTAEDAEEDPFPEEYSRSRLNKEYAALSLPKATVSLLKKYFNAFSHLYGIISLKKALSIYNSQNEPISEEDFLAFCEVARHGNGDYFVLGEEELYSDGETSAPIDREIIEFPFIIGEKYYETRDGQQGKPYYIPKKAELLRYASENYFEKTIQFLNLQNFLRNIMPVEKADALAESLVWLENSENPRGQDFADEAEKHGLIFDNNEQFYSYINLINELHNNTRTAFNRGFTPNEMYKKYSGAPMSVKMPERAQQQNLPGIFDNPEHQAPFKVTNPISKNAPCPCGSGKKYKRCCGKDKE